MKQCFAILLLTFGFTGLASATLGEAHQEMLSKAEVSQFKVKVINEKGYELREYINQDSRIFAVSWVGRSHPDLSQLLGQHYSEYQVAAQLKIKGRYPQPIKTSKMILHTYGHMGSVRGFAYEDRELPPYFDLEILK